MAIVPGGQRAHRLRLLRDCLALCLAILLAIPPLAELIPIASLQAASGSAAVASLPDCDPGGGERTFGAQGEQANAALLPRLPHVEGRLFPSAYKVMAPRPCAVIERSPPEQLGAKYAADTSFHRSSIGTARKPTGPPS